MLTAENLPHRVLITYELGDLLAKLKAADVFLVGWFDPRRGLQVWPIGDERAIRADTVVYEVPGEREVAALMAAKMMLDEGNDEGAYACLAEEMANENRRKR
jgi:hypothetical protein